MGFYEVLRGLDWICLSYISNYEDTHRNKTIKSTSSIKASVAWPLLFPPLKFQCKMAYFWGK
jgi:hypothetical protein